MSWLDAAALSWAGGAALAWLVRSRRSASLWIAVLTTLLGAAALAGAAFQALPGATLVREGLATPFGPMGLRLDPLAAVFLVPIALVGALGAMFGPAYARLGHGAPGGPGAIAFELLLATLALVVVGANMVLLLVGWELMTIVSWCLVSSDHRHPEVRAAGVNYLVAGHGSGGALALLFVFLAQAGGGWSVPVHPLSLAGSAWPPAALFALALVGFGTKAAVAPFHVWLPDAHAAAPSHVSALMSGVLVTLGFYGLVRFVPALGPVPAAWSMILILLGGLGACGGVVMALSQSDVKRVLAYSTVEHAGLVTLGLGTALLALTSGQPLVATLAFSAALLHVWNHAIAKGLLFLSGGAIAQRVGSRDLERWGGLLRRLPLLGTTLLIGAAALVGLPGTHGFASEWLLLLSLFRGSQSLVGLDRLAMLLGVVAIAFTAGTSVGCFVRIAGVGLLGHPRSAAAARAEPVRAAGIVVPVVTLAGACFALVVLIRPLLALLGPAVAELVPGAPLASVQRLAAPLPWLIVLPLAALASVLLQRAWLERSRPVRESVTWDCGYARPEPSMQYTASSLSQPVTRVLQPALRSAVRWTPPAGLWPPAMAWESRTPERALAEVYRPAFLRLAALLGFFRRFQEGRLVVYLRYVGLALLALLVWFFWPPGMPR